MFDVPPKRNHADRDSDPSLPACTDGACQLVDAVAPTGEAVEPICRELRALRERAAEAASIPEIAEDLRQRYHTIESSLGLCLRSLRCMHGFADVPAPATGGDASSVEGGVHDAMAPSPDAISTLTRTERTVLQLLSAGRTSRAIGAALYVSVRTVEKHRHNIARKLGLRGVNALLSYAVTHAELLDQLPGKKIPGAGRGSL